MPGLNHLRSSLHRSSAAARYGVAVLAVALFAAGCMQESAPELICSPGQIQCLDEGIRVCAASGTEWERGSCARDQACKPGACDDPIECPDTCRDMICEPGTRFCGQDRDDGYLVYVCDETGTTPLPCGNCAASPVNGVCYQGECVATCGISQKSYLGCDYYATDLDNAFVFGGRDEFGRPDFKDAQNSQYAIVLSNPDADRSAFVSVTTGAVEGQQPGLQCVETQPSDQVVATEVIPPKGIETIELPPRNINGTVQAKLAYRVAANIPITVYQFNPLENVEVFSNDASVLLPTNAVGSEYFVMTRRQTFDSLKGYLTIVGTQPQPTEVTIRVTARTLAGLGVPPMDPNDPDLPDTFTTTLERYEVLSIATDAIGADLTGSHIQADAPVVVYAGSEAANAPSTSACDRQACSAEQQLEDGSCPPDTWRCAADGTTPCGCTEDDPDLCYPDAKCSNFITCCADHLEQQLLPVAAWGKEYVAVRSFPRGEEADVWRILAAADGTEVSFTPAVHPSRTLERGEWFELESDTDFTITATEPVLVGQFLAAEHAPNPGVQSGDAGIGDPAFMQAVPFRQFRRDYVFLAPDKYAEDYVSVAARADTQVRIDGSTARAQAAAQVRSIADTGWEAIRLPINDGFHELRCSEPCGIMVHGYDSYVSYGYPGGLNLSEAE